MKKKDITKFYKRRIASGWREYLDLKFPYEMLGLKREDFLSKKDICELTGLIFDKEESGFVDHYNMRDMNTVHEGNPRYVTLELQWEYLREETVEEHLKKSNFLPDNLATVVRDGKVYYCRGRAGYKNPDYDYEKNPDVEYWLYEDDKELQPHDWFWTLGPAIGESDEETKQEDQRIIKLLTKFANNKNVGSDLFSGDFIYQLVSGNCGQNITNELISDLSVLANFCKTTYEEFSEQKVIITYAIRYPSNIKPFLKELKKISLKHKLPKLV